MNGYIQKLFDGKYKFTISCGFDGNGNRIRKCKTVDASSDIEAQQKLSEFRDEIKEKSNGPEFSLVVHKWFKSKAGITDRVRNDYKITINQLMRCYGQIKITEIDALIIRQKEDSLINEHGLSQSSLKKCRSVVSQVFDYGIQNKFVSSNPLTGKRSVKIKNHNERILQEQVYERLKNTGWEVQKEKTISSARIDIYAEKGCKKAIIECKDKPTLTNATQALGQLLFYRELLQADGCLLFCVFNEPLKSDIKTILKRLGVKIIISQREA